MSSSCIFNSRQGDVISRARTIGRVRVDSGDARQREYSRIRMRSSRRTPWTIRDFPRFVFEIHLGDATTLLDVLK